MRKWLFLVALCLLNQISCTRKLDKYKIPLFSDDFKNIVLFEKGSKWIYIDSISETVDTVRVSNSVLFLTGKYLRFNCDMESSLEPDRVLNYNINNKLGVFEATNYNYNPIFCLYRLHDPVDTIKRNAVQYIAKLPSYTVNGITFYNVFKYKLEHDAYITDPLPEDNPSYRYYAQNVGLIRIESIYTNYVRNVMDYNVQIMSLK